MRLHKFEQALSLANVIWQSKLRVCIGETVAEFTGSSSIQRACEFYGHLPVENLKIEGNCLYAHINEHPELVETYCDTPVLLDESEKTQLVAVPIYDESTIFIYRIKRRKNKRLTEKFKLPKDAEEICALPVEDSKYRTASYSLCKELLCKMFNASSAAGNEEEVVWTTHYSVIA